MIRSVALLGLLALPAQALPGQTIAEAQRWLQNHPTLQPAPGETLLIQRSSTPAQRFTFRASPLPVGRTAAGGGIIRTEELALVDLINGVTPDRLTESLRTLYGGAVYQDYLSARLVYGYPGEASLEAAASPSQFRAAPLQGELRAGNLYAYWLELTRRPDGVAQSGRITVFLRGDLPKLEAELRSRAN